jgi:hypothetical protein
MNHSQYIAKHFRDIHFGGNWTVSNMKECLADVNWQEATAKTDSFNTIAALVFHVNYFVGALESVLDGKPLTAKDKYSFDVPQINSKEDWDALLKRVFEEAERVALKIEQFPEEKIFENFVDEKYGTYYRNFHGVIEHMHYHLGQIVVIKKIVKAQ